MVLAMRHRLWIFTRLPIGLEDYRPPEPGPIFGFPYHHLASLHHFCSETKQALRRAEDFVAQQPLFCANCCGPCGSLLVDLSLANHTIHRAELLNVVRTSARDGDVQRLQRWLDFATKRAGLPQVAGAPEAPGAPKPRGRFLWWGNRGSFLVSLKARFQVNFFGFLLLDD